jgi:tRNA(adenine34) deaminase
VLSIESLEKPWRVALSLAWEACVEGSVPVGAVLCDGSGEIVPLGQVAGSAIAHAEINTVATLPYGFYPDHVLYTTVEPCLLCTAALRLTHIGTVIFAFEDPRWSGVDRLHEVIPHSARYAARRVGPMGGPVRAFARLMYEDYNLRQPVPRPELTKLSLEEAFQLCQQN